MRWVSAFQNTLQFSEKRCEQPAMRRETFEDAITPKAVHEFLFDPRGMSSQPLFPALRAVVDRLAAPAAAVQASLKTLIWIDPDRTFYPPAAIALGLKPQQLYVVRPEGKNVVWTATECLRCAGVAAVIAPIHGPITRVEARRLQLAAEQGGGSGLLIRPNTARAKVHIYAAATRWLVSPAAGERVVQRWQLTLVHGHGRHSGRSLLGQSFLLEKNRATGQTHFVHLSAALGDHAKVTTTSLAGSHEIVLVWVAMSFS